jgi:hypothetical protein
MKTKLITSTLVVTLYLTIASKASAVGIVPGSGGDIFDIPNILGFTNIAQLIGVIVQLIYFVAGVALFINFLIGGLQWINAGGDAKAMASARGRITNSLIGLVIVVAAFAITRIAEHVFGISITGGFNFF